MLKQTGTADNHSTKGATYPTGAPSAILSDAEIDEICAGLKQHTAKVRYLERLGLTVRRKPNGRPLVDRANYNSVISGGTPTPSAATGSGPRWTKN